MGKKLQIADLFCGAGGTSTGALEAARALGYTPELTAVNHWPVAIASHQANHPHARHLCTALDAINPRELFREGELDLLWASPECTHHSTARGGKPINDQSRATAWCVVRWAEALRPDVILVENVPEFTTWGAIGTNNRPLKAFIGATFHAWLAALSSLGYHVDHRILCAANYGDPTTRRRLIIQAVRGRRKIVWPDPTHSPKEELDLFSRRQAWASARDHVIDWDLPGQSIYSRKRPLSPKTMERIWAGLMKFGIKPFIVPQHATHAARSLDLPAPTLTTTSRGVGLTQPFIIAMENGGALRSIDQPLNTVTTAKGGAHALVYPFMVQVAHGGAGRRPMSVDEPLPTVAGNRGNVALCEPHILPQHAGAISRPVSQPLPTVTCDGAIALVEPFLINYYGTGHADSIEAPLAAVTTKDRHALVRPTVTIADKSYVLDIRFRMLQPHELAAAQGFRPGYQLTGTKTEQVKQIGNAVPRNLARAVVLAALSQRSDIAQHLAP